VGGNGAGDSDYRRTMHKVVDIVDGQRSSDRSRPQERRERRVDKLAQAVVTHTAMERSVGWMAQSAAGASLRRTMLLKLGRAEPVTLPQETIGQASGQTSFRAEPNQRVALAKGRCARQLVEVVRVSIGPADAATFSERRESHARTARGS